MRRALRLPAIVCGAASLFSTGCASVAGMAVVLALHEDGNVQAASGPDANACQIHPPRHLQARRPLRRRAGSNSTVASAVSWRSPAVARRGKHVARGRRAVDAKRILEDGLETFAADPRPLAFGELARWRYSRGATLAALGQLTRARDVLRSALPVPARPWVHGPTHIDIGKIADLAGDRASAIKEYEEAVRLCGSDGDETGAREARALAKEEYLNLSMQPRTGSTAQSEGSDSIVSLAPDGSADRHQRDSNSPPS
jgi:hypothetical protein